MAIDFAALAARLLQSARAILAEWYPQGKLHGHEFKIGDVGGSEGDSCSINVDTGKWADFAAGIQGGDLISLYAAREGVSQADAARKLDADYYGGSGGPPRPLPVQEPERKREKWSPILPVPDEAPKPTDDYYRPGPKDARGNKTWVKLKFVARWAYRDRAAKLLGYAVRFEWYEGADLHKDIVPQVYCDGADGKRSWRWRTFPEPRPLYGLDQVAARPEAPIIVVEGEKKVDALRLLAPQYVGVAWPGGASSWRKADWSAIERRTVLLWPDADKQRVKNESQAERYKCAIGDLIPRDQQPGMRAMWEIGHYLLKLCPVVKVIIPDDDSLPDGWDAADAVRDGWTWQRLKDWALPRVFNLTEGTGYGTTTNGQRDTGRHGSSGHAGERREAGGREVSAAAGVVDRSAEGVAGEPQAHRDARDDEASRRDPSLRRTEPSGLDDQGTAGGPRSDAGGARERAASARGVEGRGDADRALPRTDALADQGQAAALRAQANPQAPAPQSQVGKWLAWGIERNGNGLPIVNLNNAVVVLEADPQLRRFVWFDEFLQRLMTGDPPREWSDADDIALTLYMQRAIGISKMGRETVSQAVITMAMRDKRNCVRDFMMGEKWDETPRIESFMARVFHCEDSAYTRAASRNFWVSMVARVLSPGCKVDNMIVLEGSQGLLKSTALQAIAEPWFAEQHEQATNAKAFAEVLQGKLLVEISEMDSFDRAEVKAVKGIVSNQVDRYRAAYQRYAADHPRQGVMTGTTNKDDWNRDETGARRFWPIRCLGIADVDYVRAHRLQLFAEAVAAFKTGARWWEMPDEETRTEQRKRYDADPWIEPVSFWLSGRTETTVNEIATSCLRIETKDLDRARQMRIAACLRALQWANDGNKKRGGKVVKVWTSPADAYGAQVATEPEAAKLATEKVATENELPFQ